MIFFYQLHSAKISSCGADCCLSTSTYSTFFCRNKVAAWLRSWIPAKLHFLASPDEGVAKRPHSHQNDMRRIDKCLPSLEVCSLWLDMVKAKEARSHMSRMVECLPAWVLGWFWGIKPACAASEREINFYLVWAFILKGSFFPLEKWLSP